MIIKKVVSNFSNEIEWTLSNETNPDDFNMYL